LIVACLVLGSALVAVCVACLVHAQLAHRRRLLNEVLHELRRPLQELALRDLGLGARSGWVGPAISALADLDSIVNGRPRRARTVAFSLSDVVGEGRSRWSKDAVRFQVERSDAHLIGDPDEIASALDNLISNAVEHGSGPVTVCAGGANGSAVLSVASAPAQVTLDPRRRDPRRGHGLRIAERVATEHRGALVRPRLIGGAVMTRLILPVGPELRGAQDP
jgi:hypothetical protein